MMPCLIDDVRNRIKEKLDTALGESKNTQRLLLSYAKYANRFLFLKIHFMPFSQSLRQVKVFRTWVFFRIPLVFSLHTRMMLTHVSADAGDGS